MGAGRGREGNESLKMSGVVSPFSQCPNYARLGPPSTSRCLGPDGLSPFFLDPVEERE